MVIHLLGSTRTESQMERESTNGRMEPIMMVLLFKVWEKDLGNGTKIQTVFMRDIF